MNGLQWFRCPSESLVKRFLREASTPRTYVYKLPRPKVIVIGDTWDRFPQRFTDARVIGSRIVKWGSRRGPDLTGGAIKDLRAADIFNGNRYTWGFEKRIFCFAGLAFACYLSNDNCGAINGTSHRTIEPSLLPLVKSERPFCEERRRDRFGLLFVRIAPMFRGRDWSLLRESRQGMIDGNWKFERIRYCDFWI